MPIHRLSQVGRGLAQARTSPQKYQVIKVSLSRLAFPLRKPLDSREVSGYDGGGRDATEHARSLAVSGSSPLYIYRLRRKEVNPIWSNPLSE